MMGRRFQQDREAWTAFVEGRQETKQSKYGNVRGEYASKYEAEMAGRLAALERAGKITELREQVKFTLVEGQGKIRPIKYIADFTWKEGGELVVADAKGYAKNQVYRLKKKLMKLLLGIDIREL